MEPLFYYIRCLEDSITIGLEFFYFFFLPIWPISFDFLVKSSLQKHALISRENINWTNLETCINNH